MCIAYFTHRHTALTINFRALLCIKTLIYNDTKNIQF